MSTLRDKFNQKNKSKKEQTPDTMESFDQNSLNVTISSGKSQLIPITLTCSWNKGSLNKKNPELQCRWYNKTQTDIKQIIGVNGSNYQTCLLDVGSIVHIQCLPALPGLQYEGMPIIKEIGPIVLDPETEQQAQDLLKSQKATFFVKISTNDSLKMEQGLIKIEQNKIQFLLKKQDKITEQIYSGNITQNNPHIEVNRMNNDEIIFTFNGQKTQLKTIFGDHKIRDVFLLFLKLIIGKKFLKEQIVGQPQLLALKSKTSATDIINLGDLKKQIVRLQSQKEQLNKLLRKANNKNEDAELKNKQLEQRLQNLNKNYFEIEKQLNSMKKLDNSDKEQLSYYKNQNKNLKIQTQKLTQLINSLNITLNQKNKQLQQYQQDPQEKQKYQQLIEKLMMKDKQIEQLAHQINYAEHQIRKMEERIIEVQEKCQELFNQKQSISRKYQSLLHEKNLNPMISPTIRSMISRDLSIQQKSVKFSKDNEQEQDLNNILIQRQKQLLELKEQIRQLVEQNNYIRTIATKQKNSTSKTKLKLQLLQMKKIIGKLTETVTEKDIALQQMRKINKQLNQRIIQLNTMSTDQMFGSTKFANRD